MSNLNIQLGYMAPEIQVSIYHGIYYRAVYLYIMVLALEVSYLHNYILIFVCYIT